MRHWGGDDNGNGGGSEGCCAEGKKRHFGVAIYAILARNINLAKRKTSIWGRDSFSYVVVQRIECREGRPLVAQTFTERHRFGGGVGAVWGGVGDE